MAQLFALVGVGRGEVESDPGQVEEEVARAGILLITPWNLVA